MDISHALPSEHEFRTHAGDGIPLRLYKHCGHHRHHYVEWLKEPKRGPQAYFRLWASEHNLWSKAKFYLRAFAEMSSRHIYIEYSLIPSGTGAPPERGLPVHPTYSSTPLLSIPLCSFTALACACCYNTYVLISYTPCLLGWKLLS